MGYDTLRNENANDRREVTPISVLPTAARERTYFKLPAAMNSFVGREAELSAVLNRLADPKMRLLTLHGPGSSSTMLRLPGAGLSLVLLANVAPGGALFEQRRSDVLELLLSTRP